MITIKSQREIDLMRKAGYIVAMAHRRIEELIAPGITTRELDRAAEEVIRKLGGIPSFKGVPNPYGGIDFPASICASVNHEVIHGIPNDIPLKEGDIVSIDIGAIYEGYHGDAARTYEVGKVSPEAKRLIAVTRESFYKGIEMAREGMRIRDISRAIQQYVEQNGYSVVRDFVGHGIGREMHEEPQIPNFVTLERGPRLRKGMTLAIEPMVNEGRWEVDILSNKWTVVTKDGKLSAHYENTIVVTENEPEILTE
ncbi:type I methionyl aminopeptidase [Thermoclostridium stercorarium subsp. thermolacticum DSM 2910]|nr:type I methionyl aminopeptidase [Thermoclostridium stercorarium]AGI40524.1 methionine aminopeptidase [Thermoclostridium stercorarium subsp. stercorarium DSM 8532]ANW99803.1 type I methionyl aminopeptidase [Thermoclostridium stercorarium subsp. thermolacticum DSM 2910]UZQ85513.1 type I methionyl aminopeptidase [Thermoclostridium stercorarium]